MAGTCNLVLLILITLLFPPVGVVIVAGCGADVLINVCLTLLGYIPGHIHAFYVLYVYYSRRDAGGGNLDRAPGIYSQRVQTGGRGYATVQPVVAPGTHAQAGNYGTV